MILAYQLLGYILIPIIKFNIYLRVLKNKEDKKRYFERYGISKIKRPEGKLIWIHASSIGEFKSVTKLIDKLHNKFIILATTTTLTASNYAIKNFGNKIIHQYAPFDIKIWVNRFLKKWKPSFVLWVESDLWPTTLTSIKEKSIKSLLINSRISPKSYNKWKFFKGFFIKITNTFDEIFAQSNLDKQRLESLTDRNIKFIGNLKLASTGELTNKAKYKNFQKKFIGKKILMFASTHDGEEIIFTNLINKLLLKYKNLKVIIAPRHPDRSNSIIKMLNKKNISSSFFNTSLKLKEDVLIINSFGEMPLYYSLSDIVVLGGSFVKMGGHNPIEPAINNCVVVTGPHIYNWENIFLDMKRNNACTICKNIKELEIFLINIYEKKDKIKLLKINSKKFAKKSFFEFEKLISIINNFNKKVKC